MPPKTVPSREVQNRFGAVMDAAKLEPITVTQYGRPVVTMMSVERAAEAENGRAEQTILLLPGISPTSRI